MTPERAAGRPAPRPGGPGTITGMLDLEALGGEIAAGTIDTVLVAFADMQGRLVGKRVQGEFFLEEVAGAGVEGCEYLIATDTDMNPVPGYGVANWSSGYGDFAIVPDLDTLRRIPWLDRTALVICDLAREDGSPIAPAPRQVLIDVYERAHERGFTAMAATELEFFLFRESYAEAWDKRYRDLTPTTPYSLDYHLLATSFEEPFIGELRRGMQGAGIPVEFSKGEAWIAQHELNIRYADAITTADRHVIYKNGVKEIAQLNGLSATFMAKPAQDSIGSSCHVHISLVDAAGANAFVDGHEETDVFRHYLGGVCAHARELALLLAPSINSYKRFVSDSWAPTSVAWGRDNRSAGFRIVGHGAGRRVESRIPGGDMNPYLGIAALLAAGLDGIEQRIEPPPELLGSAYQDGDAEPFPSSLYEAVSLWEGSSFVREALGEDVWAHYLNYGKTELRLFERAVTDYERVQMFERG